jgi:hypothetical protein
LSGNRNISNEVQIETNKDTVVHNSVQTRNNDEITICSLEKDICCNVKILYLHSHLKNKYQYLDYYV